MKFLINNREWEIIEKSQEQIKEVQQKRKAKEDEELKSIANRYYGITYCDWNQIFIDKDLPYNMKQSTLLHELTHCYIANFITHEDKMYSEEDVADILANGYNIILPIYNKYFEDKISEE